MAYQWQSGRYTILRELQLHKRNGLPSRLAINQKRHDLNLAKIAIIPGDIDRSTKSMGLKQEAYATRD
jgi:hypothetical protein